MSTRNETDFRTKTAEPRFGALRKNLQALLNDRLVWLSLALFVCYFAWVAIRPHEVFWSLDEGGKYIYLQNVIKTGSASGPLLYPGRVIDSDLQFVPLFYWRRVSDEVFSWWPVGFPLLTLPFYRLFGWMGLFLMPTLSGALCALFSGLMVRSTLPRHPNAPLFSALLVGLSTPIMFYSSTFWEHSPAVMLALASLWLVTVAERTQQTRWLVLSGLAGSAATFLRTEQIFVIAGILLILAWKNWRWALIMAIPLGITILGWYGLNQQLMGSGISQQWGAGRARLVGGLFAGIRQAGIWYIPYVLFNAPLIIAYEISKPLLALGTGLVGLAVLLPFWQRLRWGVIAVYGALFALSLWVVLAKEGYRSLHGLVLIAPHILFSMWYFTPESWRQNRSEQRLLPWLLLAAIGCYLAAFLARGWMAAGGQQWGPRYLLTLYPLAVIASVCGLASLAQHSLTEKTGNTFFKVLATTYVALALTSFGFELRGWNAIWLTVTNYQQTQRSMAQMDHEPVLTTCTWLPMVIPELYWQGNIFAQTGHSEEEWMQLLRSKGIGETRLLKMDMCLNEPLDLIKDLRNTNPSGIDVTEVPLSLSE